ncbi:MAG: hypothetical protein ACRDTA_28235 [Pseudonocardiaceae bacterium]
MPELAVHEVRYPECGRRATVAGGAVGGGRQVRQSGQPLTQRRVDDIFGQTIADCLHLGHVIDRGESVVQRGEADPGLGGVALGVLVAVDAQPRGVGEIGAELEEERPKSSSKP